MPAWLSVLIFLASSGGATVDGVVLDPSGAVVPVAAVSLKPGPGQPIATVVTP